ncbi:MAG: carboxypeptidase-like regulatory domain-containing protein [Planctomycetota bacterium]
MLNEFERLSGRVQDVLGRTLVGQVLVWLPEDGGGIQSKTIVQENGEFEIHAPGKGRLSLEEPGWTLVQSTGFYRDKEGRYPEFWGLFARLGTLEIELRDANGAAKRGEQVVLQLAEWELQLLPGVRWPSVDVFSDSNGIAQFEGVPAEVALAVSTLRSTYKACAPDRSLLEGPNGQAILVPADGARRYRLQEDPKVFLTGRVRYADGAPAQNPMLYAFRFHEGGWQQTAAAGGSMEGEFLMEVDPWPPGEPLLVKAEGYDGGRGGMFSRSRPASMPTASQILHSVPTTPLDLVLVPLPTIEGTVVNADGQPVPAAIVAQHSNGSPMPGLLESEAFARGSCEEDGTFLVIGLPSGKYHLTAISSKWGKGRLESVPAGAQGVRIVLSKEEQARVKIELPEELPEASHRLRVLRLFPGSKASVDAPALQPHTQVFGPLGWRREFESPEHASQTLARGEGFVRWEERRWRGNGAPLLELAPGWYWFALSVQEDLRYPEANYGPLATELVRVADGDYTLHFACESSGGVRISIPDLAEQGGSVEPLFAGLYTKEGQPVCTSKGRASWAKWHRTTRGGGLQLSGIPEGTWQVRAGTESQLREGQFGYSGRCTVIRGQTAHLSLR